MVRFYAFIIAICLLWGSGVHGRTITLARDGSGEYTILQHALNAAASGDTILIGPGEYTEMFSVKYPGYAWNVDVVGDIKVSELTIIGAGPDQTFIGQAIQNIDYSHYSPLALGWLGGTACRIANLTLRNSYDGFQAADGQVFVENCEFSDNARGLTWTNVGSGGWVKDSTFQTSFVSSNAQLNLYGSGSGVLVENCGIGSSSIDSSVGISMVENVVLRHCELHGGRIGVQISAGASCLIDGCMIFDCEFIGVNLAPVAARCEIANSEVSGGQRAVKVYGEGIFSATNSIFTGGIYGVFMFYDIDPAFVRYCHILKGSSEYGVECTQHEEYGGVSHDFRGNYWGTDDGDQIATWILDGHDDPQILAEVLYTPFATGDSDLVIALNPNDPEIIIPETGGSFLYDASIENNTGIDIVADLTIEAVLPDGTAYPVMTLPGVTLAGASVRTRIGIVQEVPAAAPAGTYTYRVSASLGDTLLVDTAELPFEKLGGGVAAVGAMSWPVTGWLDEDRPPFQAGAVKPVLYGPVPNPFNPTTTVAFELPTQEAVSLHVFDLQGRLVRTLLNGEVVPQGRHEAVWDGRDASGRQAASGAYFFRLEAGGQVETKRAVLVK